MSKTYKYKLILLPLSLIYGFIIWLRNKLFDLKILKSHEFDIPVISVGNISVGGTGKTPHIEYLVELLKNEFKIAVLSRGYGRKTKGFIFADKNSNSKIIGDEPYQIKNKYPEIIVAVDEKRVRGINKLMENEELNLVLLDDAFQHRYVKPGINILLIDYHNTISNDFLLPAGNLREPAHEKDRAHIIFITKTPKDIKPIKRRIIEKELNIFPYQSLYFTSIDYQKPVNIFTKETIELEKYDKFLVVTGIANPKPLYNYLKDFSPKMKKLKFADHHIWEKNDFEKIIKEYEKIEEKNKIIITTEKDFSRIKDSEYIDIIKLLPIYYIPIKIDFLNKEDQKIFNKQIADYVKKNKRSYRLYQK